MNREYTAPEIIEASNEQTEATPDTLSEDEKDVLTVYIKRLGSTLRDGFQDEELREQMEEEILKFGPKALSFLSESMTADDEMVYEYSRFVDALSDQKHINLILENLRLPRVSKYPHMGAISNLDQALFRQTYYIRRGNPEDIRLRQISNSLIELLSGLDDWSNRQRQILLNSLSMTGTKEAGEYIKSLGEEFAYASRFLRPLEESTPDPTASRQIFISPHRWVNDIPGNDNGKNESRPSAGQSTNYGYYGDDDPYMYEEDWDASSDDGGYDSSNDRPMIEKETNAIEVINSMTWARGYEPTAIGAIKLHLYNFLMRNENPSSLETDREIRRLKHLSDIEKEFSNPRNRLPTIGIEVEIPHQYLDNNKIDILNKLQIPNYNEQRGLWEINPNYSYSPIVQAQIIQEMAKMGALPLTPIEKPGLGNIDQAEVPLSMHINFGIPRELDETDFNIYSSDKVLLTDVLTYAYTSDRRIKARKTSNSSSVKTDADNSSKNYDEKDYGKASSSLKLLRFEIRSMEFKDYTSFRLLTESQRIVAMFIAHMKVMKDASPVSEDRVLSVLWENFAHKVETLRDAYEMSANMADHDVQALAEIISKGELPKEARTLITEYSILVAQTLKNSHEMTLDSTPQQ